MNKYAALILAFAVAGQWITKEDGTKVCRLSMDLVTDMTMLPPSFCQDWQPGFTPIRQGQPFPMNQGWIRFDPDGPGFQFHVENNWVP